MDETFDIPATYKGKELTFKAKLLNYGYVHKIEVQVHEHVILLEPDEEKNYRVTVDPVLIEKGNIDAELVRAIVEVVQSV